MALLEVTDLRTHLTSRRGVNKAVDGVSFKLDTGKSLGVVGESGSGKSMTALSILRLVPQPYAKIVGGSIRFDGEDLLDKSEREMRKIRGGSIAIILQDPIASLNPVFSIGFQIAESVRIHQHLSGKAQLAKVIESLRRVRVSTPEARVRDYPHQFSGGMRQRVVGAIAIACQPKLLIADEATTALDTTIQAQYLDLLRALQRELNLALLFITHDFGIVARMCDDVAVMYAGRIVEHAEVREIFNRPAHPYTIGPARGRSEGRCSRRPPACDPRRAIERLCRAAGLPVCASMHACHRAVPCRKAAADDGQARAHRRVLACARGLRDRHRAAGQRGRVGKGRGMIAASAQRGDRRLPTARQCFGSTTCTSSFRVRRGPLLQRETVTLKAVDGVSFDVRQGETFSIVGESGCGKTTTARAILKVETPTSGSILWHGRNLEDIDEQETKAYRSAVQAVFQDPFSSMNPRLRVGNFITEPLLLNSSIGRKERRERAQAALQQVGLRPEDVDNFPHEFSGGQRQRVAIARAIASAPRLIVLDEPVSSLDVSIRAQIMNLLKSLQEDQGFSYLFIAHHLGTVRYMSQTVGVMYLGRMMELSQSEELFENPLHPYTQALFTAALPDHPDIERKDVMLQDDVAAATNIPSGCRLHTRCPFAKPVCARSRAGMEEGRARSLDRLSSLLNPAALIRFPVCKERQR